MLVVKAQESTSQNKFFEDGKSWLWAYYGYNNDGELEEHRYTETVIGDTVVEGRMAKKIMLGDSEGVPSNPLSYSIGYEEDGVIYNYGSHPENYDSICFYPLLDFNYNVGDSIFFNLIRTDEKYFMGEVVKDEIINVCGIERRKLTLGNKSGAFGCWVEGIGPSSGDLYLCLTVESSRRFGYHIVKCFQNGECIFTADDFLTSTDGIKDVEVSEKDATLSEDAQLYDLSGRKVTGTPRSGIYIKGGRKVLVK